MEYAGWIVAVCLYVMGARVVEATMFADEAPAARIMGPMLWPMWMIAALVIVRVPLLARRWLKP
jgi:hypothetical protein